MLRLIASLGALALVLVTPVGMQAQSAPARGFGIADAKAVAGRDFVAGEVLVGLHPGVPETATAKIAIAAAGRVVRRIGGSDPVTLLRFGDEPSAQHAIAALMKEPGVRFVERNGIVGVPPMPPAARKEGRARLLRSRAVSGDPGTPHQWHLTVIRRTPSLGLTGTPPTVAIIDSGVDYTHADLSGNVIKGKNCVDDTMDPFDDNGHGTHVAGLTAARSGNGVDGDGVSPGSKILAVKVLDSTGFGTFFDIVCGLQYARTVTTRPPTRIGNLSIGGPTSASIAAEVSAWRAAGKLLVTAAGNGNDTGAGTFNTDPDFAFRVMATEENDCRASFSTFSPPAAPQRFNIAAPGYDIYSTVPGQGFQTMNGTSMASPLVAGAAALLWGHAPGLTRDAIVARLIDSGKPTACGFAVATRRVDVRRAILQTREVAVIGRVLDGTSGEALPSASASVQVVDDATALGTDTTNGGGSYEVSGARLAGSSRSMTVSAPGYITDMLARSLTVLASAPTGPFSDVVVRQRRAGFFQAAVDWRTTQPDTAAAGARTTGWDLDLLVQQPGVTGSWLGPGPEGDLARAPNVRVFRDSFNDSEPVEALAIAPAARDGTYRILVRRFSGPEPLELSASRAYVRLYDGDAAVFRSAAPRCTAEQPFWHVANVRKRATSYTVERVGICRESAP